MTRRALTIDDVDNGERWQRWALIVRGPARWSTAAWRLARVAAMSRSTFAARFTEPVGKPAMTYVAHWRMNLAHARLSEGTRTVNQVATDLDYGSEAAFTRAFTRVIGTPGAVRRAKRLQPASPGPL